MKELKKTFEPGKEERRLYNYWLDNDYFKPDKNNERQAYSIVIPPPNVTGSLHMGHALNVTLQDILTRWKRMRGYKVLWLPGTDHAGIATQNVIEKQLAQKGISRYHLGRDDFVKNVWEWKKEYGNRIVH